MRILVRAINLVRNLLRKRKVEDEISEEILSFVSLTSEEKRSEGLNESQAHREALLEVGGVEQIKEQVREARVGYWIEALLRDFNYGLRSLRRSPGFSLIVILVLALGIGANSAIFSVIEAVLLKPLPYRDPDRLVVLWERNPSMSSPFKERIPVAYVNFTEWIRRNTEFEVIGGFETTNFNLSGVNEPERIDAARASANIFAVLGVQPRLGTSFDTAEKDSTKSHVVILADSFFRTHFTGDGSVLGRTLVMNDVPYLIVGVLPPSFHLPGTYEGTEQLTPGVWVPYDVSEAANDPDAIRRKMKVFARLRNNVSLEQARAEMTRIAARLSEENPDENAGFGTAVFPMRVEDVGRAVRRDLFLLFGAVGFVLLIACANIANLMLTRVAVRKKEMAIRKALGASRWTLLSRLLAEGLLLSAAGAILGLSLAHFGVKMIVAMQPAGINRPEEIHLGVPVFVFTGVLAVFTGVLFGIVPALQASGTDVSPLLTQMRSRHPIWTSWALRKLLVISEVTLASVLLIGAGFLIKSLATVLQVDSGFSVDHLLTLKFSLPPSRYFGSVEISDFCGKLLERASAIPGVKSASFSDGLPLTRLRVTQYTVEGQKTPPRGSEPTADLRGIFNPEYFETVGIKFVAGRNFTAEELKNKRSVVVINQRLAKTLWPKQDPIGRHIFGLASKTSPTPPMYSVIGEVRDTRQESLETATRPEITKAMIDYTHLTLALRTINEPESLIPFVKRQVWAVDPDLPVYEVQTMKQVIEGGTSLRRFQALLMTAFAGIALVLAGIGLYGVLSSVVSQRTHEIGVRMALGAPAKDVMRLVVGEGLWMAALGLILGVGGGICLSRYLQSSFFGVSSTEPATYIQVAVLIGIIAAVACAVPARRAIRLNPMDALRYE